MLCDRFEAEDAVQNLYVKLWERREELNSLVSPEAYCRTMLRNICIDRWRFIRAHDCDVELSAEEVSCCSPPEIEGNESFLLPDLYRSPDTSPRGLKRL